MLLFLAAVVAIFRIDMQRRQLSDMLYRMPNATALALQQMDERLAQSEKPVEEKVCKACKPIAQGIVPRWGVY